MKRLFYNVRSWIVLVCAERDSKLMGRESSDKRFGFDNIRQRQKPLSFSASLSNRLPVSLAESARLSRGVARGKCFNAFVSDDDTFARRFRRRALFNAACIVLTEVV